MHDSITKSSAALSQSSDDLLSPITPVNRTKATNSSNWPGSDFTTNRSDSSDNWRVPLRTSSGGRLPTSAQKKSSENTNNGVAHLDRQWRYNSSGQLVDSDSAADFDLANEIMNLNMGGTGDSGDDVRGSLKTPAKAKAGGLVSVTQLSSETSPIGTASASSVDSGEPISHSRESSAEISAASQESLGSKNLRATTQASLKINTDQHKERPHSFSGGLSQADLRRLQGEAVSAQNERPPSSSEQPTTYPSLANQSYGQGYDYSASGALASAVDDLQSSYNNNMQQQSRNFNNNNRVQTNGTPYRQQSREFPPHGLVPSPTGMSAYQSGPQAPPPPPPHIPLGNAQQLYEMMLPAPQHDSVARVQQQHNIYRHGHQHSASDPSSALRDATALALLNAGVPPPTATFGPPPPAPGLFPGNPATMAAMYANQFYRDAYARADLAAAAQAQAQAQALAAAGLQQQYQPYGVLPIQSLGLAAAAAAVAAGGAGGDGAGAMVDQLSSGGSPGGGPSANNRKLGLYKTELCRSWEEKGTCRYGSKCQFAHGEDELRKVARHPKYKTEICRTFWVSGSCPYGKRCCFIHTELPAGGAPPGADGTPPPATVSSRERSASIHSDSESSMSLLARINAKRPSESSSPGSSASGTPSDGNKGSSPAPISGSTPTTATNGGYPLSATAGRPNLGPLRIDTKLVDSRPSLAQQQNKSAYPSLAPQRLLPLPDRTMNTSPAPATAGPDLGRHNSSSRAEIVGYSHQQQRMLNLSSPLTTRGPSPPYPLSPGETTPQTVTPRGSGHVRSGSAGNWSGLARSVQRNTASPQPYTSMPIEGRMNTPWSSNELGGFSRLSATEKAWA